MIEIFLVFLFFFPPIIANLYITTFFGSIVFITTIALLNKKNHIFPVAKFYMSWLLFLCITIFVTTFSSYFDSAWAFRDMIRPLVIILFIIYLYNYFQKKDPEVLLSNIYKIFILFLLINGVFSMMYVYDRNMVGFLQMYNHMIYLDVRTYARFIGLFGNPNFDGMIFGYGFLLMLTVYSSGKYSKLLITFLLLLVLFGMLVSGSRSVMGGIFITLLIYSFLSGKLVKNLLYAVVLVSPILLLTLYVDSIYEQFFYRIETVFNYTSNERVNIVADYIHFFLDNPISMIFGNMGYTSSAYVNFTDNDYILLVLKYGLFGLFYMLFMQIHVIMLGNKLAKITSSPIIVSLGKYLMMSSIFSLIISIANGPFGMPKVFLLNLIFYVLALSIKDNLKKKDGKNV